MAELSSNTERSAGRIFDLALCAALFIAPLFMGGRGPYGKFVFACCVSLMAIAWIVQVFACKSKSFQRSGAEWILIAGALLLIAQLIPLPEALLLAISPHLQELLPIWFSSPDPSHFQIGTWNTLSLSPDATRQALAVYLAYAVFFMLVVQRLKTPLDAIWLFRSLAYGTVALAILGLAQFLVGNGKFLWFYEHPFRTTENVVKGPFQNQNHFAHMMALGIGPLLWMLALAVRNQQAEVERASSTRKRRNGFSATRTSSVSSLEVMKLTFAIGLVALAVMLTISRGGFLAFTSAALVTLGIYRWQSFWRRGSLKIAAGIALIVSAALCIHGYEPLAKRLSTLRDSQSLEELSHGRRALWDSMLEATQSFWLTGTGIGSHSDVYPIYMQEAYNVEFTHGESGYLPLLMEGGVGAMLLLACAVLLLARRLIDHFRRTKLEAKDYASLCMAMLTAPLCAAIVASLVHSLGDFVWYISACMSWTLVFAAITIQLPRLVVVPQRIQATQTPNPAGGMLADSSLNLRPIVATVCIAIVAFCISTLLPSARAAVTWNEYRRIARNNETESLSTGTVQTHLLMKTLQRDPNHRHANLLLAQQRWQDQQEQRGASDQVASIDSGNVCLFDNSSYFINTIKNHPLQGTAYAFAMPAETADTESLVVSALLDQALRVRKHDAVIHMVQGRRLIAMGELEQGFEHWKFSFNQDNDVQASLIAQLRPIFPASFLIEKLQPESPGLWKLYYAYVKDKHESNISVVASALIDRLKTAARQSDDPLENAEIHYKLHTIYNQINDNDSALSSIRIAAEAFPEQYRYRYALATTLHKQSQHAEAIKHLKWCQARRPDNAYIARILKDSVRVRIAENAVRY